MFHKILVPLDGSVLAEKALPYAVDLASRLDAQLMLLTVVKLPVLEHHSNYYKFPTLVKPETLLTQQAELDFSDITTALDYLTDVQTTITDAALASNLPTERVSTLLAYDRPLSAIPEIARDEGADLIVMTTHGRGGLLRLVCGSTASSVISNSTLPVIVIRPDEKLFGQSLEESLNVEKPSSAHRPVVVTLDGTAYAEEALPPAVQMATALATHLNLLRVMPESEEIDPTYLLSTYGAAFANDAREANRAHRQELAMYLSKLQHKVADQGVSCVGVLSHGEPEKKIVEYVERVSAEMLVMSTHAPNALEQFFEGSLTAAVLHHTSLPIMLINCRRYDVTAMHTQPIALPRDVVLN